MSITEITQTNDSQGFDELENDAHDGGTIAGDARKALEKKTGKGVVSTGNYVEKREDSKGLDR